MESLVIAFVSVCPQPFLQAFPDSIFRISSQLSFICSADIAFISCKKKKIVGKMYVRLCWCMNISYVC